jgi:hypothetical protein
MLIKNYLNKLLEGYRMQNIDKLVEDIYNEILERNNIKHDNSSNNREAIPEEETGIGAGIKFQRLRRITGYLVGTIDRWNDGKRAELADRIKHN